MVRIISAWNDWCSGLLLPRACQPSLTGTTVSDKSKTVCPVHGSGKGWCLTTFSFQVSWCWNALPEAQIPHVVRVLLISLRSTGQSMASSGKNTRNLGITWWRMSFPGSSSQNHPKVMREIRDYKFIFQSFRNRHILWLFFNSWDSFSWCMWASWTTSRLANGQGVFWDWWLSGTLGISRIMVSGSGLLWSGADTVLHWVDLLGMTVLSIGIHRTHYDQAAAAFVGQGRWHTDLHPQTTGGHALVRNDTNGSGDSAIGDYGLQSWVLWPAQPGSIFSAFSFSPKRHKISSLESESVWPWTCLQSAPQCCTVVSFHESHPWCFTAG